MFLRRGRQPLVKVGPGMVKQAKREKREIKKATKTAFADENKKLAAQQSSSGEINRIPVFRY